MGPVRRISGDIEKDKTMSILNFSPAPPSGTVQLKKGKTTRIREEAGNFFITGTDCREEDEITNNKGRKTLETPYTTNESVCPPQGLENIVVEELAANPNAPSQKPDVSRAQKNVNFQAVLAAKASVTMKDSRRVD
jgi:hypothetical protein